MPFMSASERQKLLRALLFGVSGSGKTFSALLLATYLAIEGRIALIDTEHGAASDYSGIFKFDVLELPSGAIEGYQMAMTEAALAGYEVLIIDSLTHSWAGKDGLLERKDKIQANSRSKDGFSAWRDVTPLYSGFIAAMQSLPMHLITTARAKTEYAMERNENTGKVGPRAIGLAPVLRDGMEYEFNLMAFISDQHVLEVRKAHCASLMGREFPNPGKEFADLLTEWLKTGTSFSAGEAKERLVKEGKQRLVVELEDYYDKTQIGPAMKSCGIEKYDPEHHDEIRDALIALKSTAKPTGGATAEL